MTIALPTNVTHYADLYVWANNTTGYSTIGILVFLFAIAFLGTQRYGASLENSYLLSLTATFMASGAFMLMGALNGVVVSILAILLFLSYIYTYHA